MLVIRLKRVGKKHQPGYRLVVSERRSKIGRPPAEDLGSYNPFTKLAVFNQERVRYWLGVGAKPTPTVHNLLVKLGVIGGPKVKIYMKKAEAKPVEPAASPEKAPAAEQAVQAEKAAEQMAT